jgi:UDP-N-acetylmuramoylalanine--D-glutamate ligase
VNDVGILSGQRVVVMGLGKSGRSAARLALREGAEVIAVDLKVDADPVPGARMELGPHNLDTFTTANVVVVSPGIAAASPELVAARAAGVDVVGELGFALRFLHAPVIAITGTNGKSTVTHFTGTLMAATGKRVFTGGNLGTPLSDAAFGSSPEVLVLEVSSYQLELPGELAPVAAVILNLTPDHLGRHGTMDGYAAAKAKLFARMGDGGWAFLPAGDERLIAAAKGVGRAHRAWLGAHPGVLRQGRTAHVLLGHHQATFDLSGVAVQGAHNLDHAATAAALCFAAGASQAAIQAALPTLTALPHRVQPVIERDGVLWINDSKATNVASTSVAVAGIDRPCVVLLGGLSKENDPFEPLANDLKRHRAVIGFGASGPAIAAELARFGVDVIVVPTMREACARAAQLARPGDAVLLSPAGASFDEFKNFEHRGDVFAAVARGEVP